jgi:hypothetical protein
MRKRSAAPRLPYPVPAYARVLVQDAGASLGRYLAQFGPESDDRDPFAPMAHGPIDVAAPVLAVRLPAHGHALPWNVRWEDVEIAWGREREGAWTANVAFTPELALRLHAEVTAWCDAEGQRRGAERGSPVRARTMLADDAPDRLPFRAPPAIDVLVRQLGWDLQDLMEEEYDRESVYDAPNPLTSSGHGWSYANDVFSVAMPDTLGPGLERRLTWRDVEFRWVRTQATTDRPYGDCVCTVKRPLADDEVIAFFEECAASIAADEDRRGWHAPAWRGLVPELRDLSTQPPAEWRAHGRDRRVIRCLATDVVAWLLDEDGPPDNVFTVAADACSGTLACLAPVLRAFAAAFDRPDPRIDAAEVAAVAVAWRANAVDDGVIARTARCLATAVRHADNALSHPLTYACMAWDRRRGFDDLDAMMNPDASVWTARLEAECTALIDPIEIVAALVFQINDALFGWHLAGPADQSSSTA